MTSMVNSRRSRLAMLLHATRTLRRSGRQFTSRTKCEARFSLMYAVGSRPLAMPQRLSFWNAEAGHIDLRRKKDLGFDQDADQQVQCLAAIVLGVTET